MVKAPKLPTPLAIGKTDWPKNPLAKGALTIVSGAIGRGAKTIKTMIGLQEFWTSLGAYCSRNLAEVNGLAAGATGAAPAPKPAAAVKRPHRKTAGAA